MMSRLVPRFVLACIPLLLPGVSYPEKLNTLIPGLYGGDGITLAGAEGGPFPSHAPHFLIASADSFHALNNTIAAQVGAIPFASAASGFAFRYDDDLGTFVQVAESFGPIYAERAESIGAGRFNANLSFAQFQYSEFLGADLDHLVVSTLHEAETLDPDDVRTSFELDTVDITMDLDIRIKSLVFAGTYGITDRFDIGILVPFSRVEMNIDAHADVVKSPENLIPVDVHTFEGGPESPNDRANGSANGLGDIWLRAKYHWLESESNNLAAEIVVKTSTGDDSDFLGTGEATARPLLVYSRTFGSFTPHINLGYEFNFDDSKKNSLEYAAGFDYGSQLLTFAVSVLGSREMNGDGIADTIINGATGVKFNPFGNYIVTVNALFPLNDDGLRSDLIATVGIEKNF